MALKDIAAALGGTVNGSWINIPGPGHRAKDRSLGILFDSNARDGFRIKSFADDPAACREYVKSLLAGVSSRPVCAARQSNSEQEQKNKACAVALFHDSVAITGTLAESYLRYRGIVLSSFTLAADALRFHPRCPFGNYLFPAMVALCRDVKTGEAVGVHRTALSDNGVGKRHMPHDLSPKMMLGKVKDAAVMLEPWRPRFGIAEGIETALSAGLIARCPVWAALSAGGIKSFPVITGSEFLRIFADDDSAGRAAARECGQRYSSVGIGAHALFPKGQRGDWNDYLQEIGNK